MSPTARQAHHLSVSATIRLTSGCPIPSLKVTNSGSSSSARYTGSCCGKVITKLRLCYRSGEGYLAALNLRVEARACKSCPVMGGIIADRVGYGKTIIMLALIEHRHAKSVAAVKSTLLGLISLRKAVRYHHVLAACRYCLLDSAGQSVLSRCHPENGKIFDNSGSIYRSLKNPFSRKNWNLALEPRPADKLATIFEAQVISKAVAHFANTFPLSSAPRSVVWMLLGKQSAFLSSRETASSCKISPPTLKMTTTKRRDRNRLAVHVNKRHSEILHVLWIDLTVEYTSPCSLSANRCTSELTLSTTLRTRLRTITFLVAKAKVAREISSHVLTC